GRTGARSVGAAAAIALLLFASAFASGAAARGSDVTTVTLVARAAHAGSLDAAIARFEQLHPNITINASYSNPTATILNGLKTGTGAAIVGLSTRGSPIAGLPSLWELGPRYLVDLTNRPWVREVWRPLLPFASVSGRVYGQPINTGSIQFVAYNKTLFTE